LISSLPAIMISDSARVASNLMGKYKNHKYLWPGSSSVFSRIYVLTVDKNMEDSWWIEESRAPQEE